MVSSCPPSITVPSTERGWNEPPQQLLPPLHDALEGPLNAEHDNGINSTITIDTSLTSIGTEIDVNEGLDSGDPQQPLYLPSPVTAAEIVYADNDDDNHASNLPIALGERIWGEQQLQQTYPVPSQNQNVPVVDAIPIEEEGFQFKVIMVGTGKEKSQLARAIVGMEPKRKTLRPMGSKLETWRPKGSLVVKIYTWKPGKEAEDNQHENQHMKQHEKQHEKVDENFTFTIWDVRSLYAGAHPSTQGLFFSANSLYILVWDLGVSKREDMEDDDDEENDNEFLSEEYQRQADRALHHDIQDRVLSWLDHIIPSGSAILPVAYVNSGMDKLEVDRRCDMLQNLLKKHPVFIGDQAPIHFPILKIYSVSGKRFPKLQEKILDIGRKRVNSHVWPEVSRQTLETIRRLKQGHKVILLVHLISEMNERTMNEEAVIDALRFLSSTGEILYFGNSIDDILSQYIILSPKWLVSALSCILRPDLQRELVKTRRLMNLHCEFCVESDSVQTLLNQTNSNCPILSAGGPAMLWQSWEFMRKVADQNASNTLYEFLERLLLHFGILLPLKVAAEPTYFVPSLLEQKELSDLWCFKTRNAWMTTLCHSWLFQDGIATAIMEHATIKLLKDLYQTVHVGSDHAIGHIKVVQVNCWASAVLVKCRMAFANSENCEQSSAEIYVAMVDEHSNHCVDIKSMRNGMKRLIVCGKGQVGRHGQKLWKGGYELVLDSIKASLADSNGFDRHVVCPECLAHLHPSCASSWSWKDVKSSANWGDSAIRCAKGHSVDTNLLCGHEICPLMVKPSPPFLSPDVRKKVKCCVVLVGLWDSQEKIITSIGSGFVADQSLGLIVTARHVFFNLDYSNSGIPYFGLKHCKAIIGVIPDGSETAVFRYFAEIVSENVQNVDACVLRITARMEQDMIGDGEGFASQSELPVSGLLELQKLRMTTKFESDESVHIVGFNQGLLEKGKHVNLSVDFAKGYICKMFQVPARGDDENSDSASSISIKTFSPLKEIIVDCKTLSGQSGGPCIDGEGKVIGILSRADKGEGHRCYLVPASELRKLVRKSRAM